MHGPDSSGPTPQPPTDTGTPVRWRAPRRLALAVLLAATALLSTSCLIAAPTAPPPLRYRDSVFTGVTKTADIAYGQAMNRQGSLQTLRLDLYEPAGDSLADRPLVIWIHGGSFAFGSKTSPEIVDQANVFAKKGYVNASIQYRLSTTGCTRVDSECLAAIQDAIEDAQAAVRFFRAHAAQYRVDPDRIAIAGTSAGAIAALNVAHNTPTPESSGNDGYSSSVSGAVSLSGATIFDYASPDDAPALLFHGDADTVVPYAWAQNTANWANREGVETWLITWEGDAHVPYSEHRDQILTLSTNFFYNTIVAGG